MAAIGFAVLLRRRSGLRRGWLRTESHRPATSSASRASSTGPYEPFPVPSLWRRLHPECFSSQNAFHAQPGHEASGEQKHKRPEPYGEPLSWGDASHEGLVVWAPVPEIADPKRLGLQ